MIHYERPATAVAPERQSDTEEYRRLLLENDMTDAHQKGLRVCRLWQLLLILNVTIIFITFTLIFLLLFIIGPLFPYQTHGQSCRTSPCNLGQGLVCNTKSICASQLLTLSPVELYPSLTLSQISSLVSSNTNYFIGLSEQPGNWQWVDGSLLLSSSMNLFCTNGSINQFDNFFRTYMNCGIYRMDSCLARTTCQRVDMNFICEKTDLAAFLQDDKKTNLIVYELEFNESDNPNDKLRAYAKTQGQRPCRLWLILFLVNLAILTVFIFLILLLLVEVGAVPPYQTYGKRCIVGKCDTKQGLICTDDSNHLKTCRCPPGNWFWSNGVKCRECPPNWIISNEGTSCYFVSHTNLNFTDANLWCMKSQSHLIEISNENIFISLQEISTLKFSLTNLYWIGLREIGPNKNIYRWVASQSMFSSSNYFCSGQPAHTYNYYFQQYDQCIALYIQSNTSSCLHDSTCPNALPFICELLTLINKMIIVYNNTPLKICVDNITYDNALHVNNTIWHIFGFLAVVIGIPGHILQIILSLNKTNRKVPTAMYFIAIAIFETIFLLALFWLWCANMSWIQVDPREVLSCGVFYSILIAIDQSILILYPTRYRSIVTRSHVLIRIFLILIIVLILVIPHHYYFYYNPQTTLFLCDFYPSLDGRRLRLFSLIHATFCALHLPILLHNRCKYKRRYNNNLSIGARRMHRNSIIIFVFSFGLLFSLLPSCILQVFIIHDRFYYDALLCSARWKLYKVLLRCFLIFSSTNYSNKFYIHLLISLSFRQQFIQLITCQSKQQSNRPNTTNQNEQYLLSVRGQRKEQNIE
ncbi:hypothetical protein I4U23_030713 [Adineta vaga]|nr:hypothetical protein I4U23_030713 [Adineta vaga]